MPVAKRRQQGSGSMMIWVEILDQTIIGPFKVEGVEMNSTNYCDLMDKIFFACY